ncbi:XTP/dITP diphosphatase [Maioricimonas sp. JC845]|uniref:XTP/dITP diphosphatase n=1 Tax=Maioricimonas sp. JC845 TaxID=3232138 RepID=UPI00345A3C81
MSTSSSTTIVLASRNAKKLGELRELLAPGGLNVVSVGDFPDVPEVVEDGTTFAENAAKKATQTARYLQQWALGEDSGLMVDALDGAPGIYSARYSGPDATDERNNQKLIEALSGVPPHKRGAGYVCSIAVADPQGEVQLTVEQRCRGRISEEPRGTNGFGYDPYFLIPEYHRTFGELSPVVKRQLSHRGRALRQLVPALTKLFS